MKAPRWGCPWQGSGLLLGLLLWSLLPSPTASQDLATQFQALKAAVPDSQRGCRGHAPPPRWSARTV
jgi:hypothetical protein